MTKVVQGNQKSCIIPYKMTMIIVHLGYIQCLAQLSILGNVERDAFNKVFETWQAQEMTYHPMVMEKQLRPNKDDAMNTSSYKIVGTGTLVVEQKLLRSCGKVGGRQSAGGWDRARKNIQMHTCSYLTLMDL